MKSATALRNRWRFMLPTYAEHLSGGDWKQLGHLKYATNIVAPAIAKGNARIIINMPPRHGKSETFSRWLPTYLLDWYPKTRVILTSYESEVARDWGRKVRDEFEQSNETMTATRRDVHASNRWHTTHGGGMVTAGVGGPITGRGADIAICDDPHKNYIEATSITKQRQNENWWRSTFVTRLEPNASILVIMTRWCENDLTGFLLREQPERWVHIRLPAIAEENDPMGRKVGEALSPERYDRDALESKKDEISSHMFAAMYQQRPAPEAGAIFKRDWLRFYRVMPTEFDRIVQSWDLAFKGNETSDFVVGQVWGINGVDKYLLDQVRGRFGFSDTLGVMRQMMTAWPNTSAVYVEDKANGPAVIDTLIREVVGLVPVDPKGGKIPRARAVEPQFEAGQIHLPDPSIAPWIDDYIVELLTFPNAANDDQVDSTTQVLLQLTQGYEILIGRA